MRCCQIPNQNNPVFPSSLVPDAASFSRYVGGEPLEQIGDQVEPGVLTSALHLEMKLWKPTKFKKPYEINNSLKNSWVAMLAGWNSKDQGDRFNADEKQGIEKDLASLADIHVSGSCGLTDFDGWHLKLMVELRRKGQDQDRKPILPIKHAHTTSLASFGRAQKLINIFLKYELCWQVAGRWENEDFVVYAQHRIPNLPQYLCALHAPIDRILLEGGREKEQEKTDFGLLGTPLGRWLLVSEMIESNGDLKQSSEGKIRPWSKLDCLRTYYGLQLMLRRIAMNTWTAGCACGGGPKGDPDVAAKALTVACAKWFENKYGEKHRCGQGQTDWVKAACDLPEQVIQETIKVLGLKPSSDAGPGQSKAKSANPSPAKLSKGGDPASSGQKPVIWLNELNSKDSSPHESALRVVSECDSPYNLGAICYKHSCLDAKKDLVNMITQKGGDFMTAGPICRVRNVCPPKPKTPGKTCCWSGSGYVAGIHFNSRADAVRYLKQYFEVRACDGNLQFTQQWIKQC